MKILLCMLMLISACSPSEQSVYVCDSKGAARYHYKAACRGLGNCQHAIISIPIEEARKRGRTLCRWED